MMLSKDLPETLAAEELRKMHAYWRAANYLSVGQIYLLDNPLLKEPLMQAHIKPRLLGHWGTTPGLNFLYVRMNRVIKMHDLNAIYVAGTGHGGLGVVANTYLEGTYSEVYPNITPDAEGMKKLFKQLSYLRRAAVADAYQYGSVPHGLVRGKCHERHADGHCRPYAPALLSQPAQSIAASCHPSRRGCRDRPS